VKLEVVSRLAGSAARSTPLLFVHGAWHGAWCWEKYFLDYFAARGWNCHALSLRGHGASEGRERLRWSRIADYVADVAEVAASLPKRPVIIGHSMGGAVTQKYLEKHSAPAAALLASVPPAGVLPTVLHLIRHHPGIFLQMNLRMSLYPMVATPALARQWFFSEALPEAELMEYHAQLQDEAYAGFLDMLAFNLAKPSRVPRLPLLVLGAERDTVFTVPQVQATAAAYGTQATIFPDMAHDMMLEPGWAAVADHILGWLRRQNI
jgi:pimeloyl-ACP methyl ester carboxylesterase